MFLKKISENEIFQCRFPQLPSSFRGIIEYDAMPNLFISETSDLKEKKELKMLMYESKKEYNAPYP